MIFCETATPFRDHAWSIFRNSGYRFSFSAPLALFALGAAFGFRFAARVRSEAGIARAFTGDLLRQPPAFGAFARRAQLLPPLGERAAFLVLLLTQRRAIVLRHRRAAGQQQEGKRYRRA